MKWDKAIELIEGAIARDDSVLISYHRRWMPQDCHLYQNVECVAPYEWRGGIRKAVNVSSDSINEGTHIIDEVCVDSFFSTHSGKPRREERLD